jgi:hypothetical protein
MAKDELTNLFSRHQTPSEEQSKFRLNTLRRHDVEDWDEFTS